MGKETDANIRSLSMQERRMAMFFGVYAQPVIAPFGGTSILMMASLLNCVIAVYPIVVGVRGMAHH